jgi:hypothetical protein
MSEFEGQAEGRRGLAARKMSPEYKKQIGDLVGGPMLDPYRMTPEQEAHDRHQRAQWIAAVAGMGESHGTFIGPAARKPSAFAADRTGGGKSETKKIAQDSKEFAIVMREVNNEIAEAGRIYEATRTPLEKYNAEMDRLNHLAKSGLFKDDETFGRAAAQALERLSSGTTNLAVSMERTNQLGQDLGMTFASAFEDAIVEGERFGDVLKSLWKDVQRLVIRQTVTAPLAAGISSLIGGITGSLMGAPTTGSQMAAIRGAHMRAGGGAISGPGSGTSDSILARLSDGEFVVNAKSTQKFRHLLEAINDNTFARGGAVGIPRFAAGGFVAAGGGGVHITLENKSTVPLKMEQSKQQKGPDGRHIIKVMIQDAVKAGMRSGEFDASLGARYGAAPQPIGR